MKTLTRMGVVLLGLAACSNPAKHQSAGFSGLSSEPAVTQTVTRDARYAMATLAAEIPVRAVRSGSRNRADHAELAVRKAKGANSRSKAVQVGGQTLALSVLYVNQIPYAVLKPQSGRFKPGVAPGTSAAMVVDAQRLTGCPAASRVYAVGMEPGRPQGLAMALACSG